MRAARMLRWARQKAGLTQRELAARTGIPQSTIARVEGGADPHVRTLNTLLRGCGFELEPAPWLAFKVDRNHIRGTLALTPARRLARVSGTANNLREWRGIARRATAERLRSPG